LAGESRSRLVSDKLDKTEEDKTMKKYLPLMVTAAMLVGFSGCNDETHTTVKKEVKVDGNGNEKVKTETKTTTIDRNDTRTGSDDRTTTTTVKKETKVDDSGNEKVKTETKTETKVGDRDADGNLIKIGPLEIKK
jgi:hypothetical protein